MVGALRSKDRLDVRGMLPVFLEEEKTEEDGIKRIVVNNKSKRSESEDGEERMTGTGKCVDALSR